VIFLGIRETDDMGLCSGTYIYAQSELRETIDETANKVEAYNALSDWARFGAETITASNDPDEMEKAIGYNLLICNSVIVQNMVDLTDTINKLQKSGVSIGKEDIARLSPYLTSHIKRFGGYVLDLDTVPKDISQLKCNAFLQEKEEERGCIGQE